MMPLLTESFSHDLRPAQPFDIFAKRYTWSGSEFPELQKGSTSASSSSGQTRKERYNLIFFHGIGFVKECFEPMIESLFVESARRDAPFVIEEAWAIDNMNHGESGSANAEVLRQPEYATTWHTAQWSDGAYEFIKAKIGIDERTGKTKTKLVAVGHSIGGVVAFDIAQKHPSLFTSVTVFDPILFPIVHLRALDKTIHAFAIFAHTRRDIFPSKKVAFQEYSESRVYKTWDPRSRALFVEHGMMDHPMATAPYPFKGVTMRCTREQEAATCRGGRTFTEAVLPKLPWITDLIPCYAAFGEVCDTLPKFVQDTLVEPENSNFVQVVRVPGTGHLLVFEKPDACASTLYDFLQHLTLNVVLPESTTPSLAQTERRRKEQQGKRQGEPTVLMMPARL